MKLPGQILILLFAFMWFSNTFAQGDPTWDNVFSSVWPEGSRKVEIASTLDGEMQAAIVLEAYGDRPRPLIISLHTWSGNYEQNDTLAWTCLRKNYNYIHPDFRGRNNNPRACGSKYAIQDIEDAIQYVLDQGKVDTSQIHVIGASGGGYATLLTYMKTAHPVKTFSAWVPISDLQKWYYESMGRGNKYALEIAQSTVEHNGFTRDNHYLGIEEAVDRSPFFMETPTEKRKNSKLYIYAGIHDGYTGSVPITQSLQFYNKVVKEFSNFPADKLISDVDMMQLVTARNYIEAPQGIKKDKIIIGDRLIYYERTFKDLLKIVIFDGGHEMLTDVALKHVEARRILAIGDSNGATKEGWVYQLRTIHFDNFIHNASISGNTIGFDNNGNKGLNTLRNFNRYLKEAELELGSLNDIVIMLGTNDCKAIFNDSLKLVPKNLKNLISGIKTSSYYQKHQPRIFIISPPPYGEDEVMKAKYHGGAERVEWLQPRFRKIASKHGCGFVDVYSKLRDQWDQFAPDGIHPSQEAQKLIANTLSDHMDY